MMSFIQRYFFVPRLLALFRRNRTKKAFVPLKEARSIGIIADLRKSGNVLPLIQFAKTLHKQDRRCHVLVIVPDKRKELNSFEYEKHFPGMPVELICQDELSFFKSPKKALIEPFISSFYDIVFYLDTTENFSLQSVLWQSKAKMYAGPEGLCQGIFDFEISLNERTDLPFLTDNLVKYLQSSDNNQDIKQKSESFKLF